MSVSRPNILWICSDQQRWDTVARLGNSKIRTPHLDDLARGGVAFRRAYAQSPICTPSRASMLTGRYPAAHSVYRNGNDIFPRHEILVTRMLADVGYDCGLVGKLHLSAAKAYERRPDDGYRVFQWSHHPRPDFKRGHDYEDWLRFEKRVDSVALYRGVADFCGPGVPAEYSQSAWCAEMATRFIQQKRDAPWLLSVNFFDPHAPFDAPPEYLERYRADDMEMPLWRESDGERWRDFAAIDQQQVRPRDPRTQTTTAGARTLDDSVDFASSVPLDYDALAVKANYYAMIEQIDTQVGRIGDALRESGQLSNTVVIFHSDHGELLGDHGLMLKGCRFFDGLVRVPFIWSFPERFQAGLESDALVELVDIAPTLLALAGIENPWWMQGRSLLRILDGSAGPHIHKRHVISEFRDSIAGRDRTHGSMVFDGRWKSIVYHGHPIGEIFDHANDPSEYDNLWGDRECRLDRLSYHLDAMMETIDGGPPRVHAY